MAAARDATPTPAAAAVAAHQSRTNELLRQSVRVTEETLEVSRATHVELLEQRETLERVDRKIDDINGLNAQSSYLLRGMSGVFGRLVNFVTGPPRPVASSRPPDSDRKAEAAPHTSTSASAPRSSLPTSSSAPAASTSRATRAELFGDTAPSASSADQDALLDVLSANVRELHQSAVSTGEELDSQITLVARVDERIEKAKNDTRRNERKARRIARS